MQGLLDDAPPLDATPPPWFLAQGLLEVKLFGTPSTRFTPIRSPPWLQACPPVPPNPDASLEQTSQSRRVQSPWQPGLRGAAGVPEFGCARTDTLRLARLGAPATHVGRYARVLPDGTPGPSTSLPSHVVKFRITQVESALLSFQSCTYARWLRAL
jgi:hypothetical protein